MRGQFAEYAQGRAGALGLGVGIPGDALVKLGRQLEVGYR